MSISPARILSFIVLLTASLGGASVLAGGQSLISTNSDHVAIQGYDPVAYFTDGKAMMGSADHSYQFDGAIWHFASDVHRALFIADPDRYMPQYGGFCANTVANNGGLTVANPNAWVVVEGKLYMFAGAKFYGGWTPTDISAADLNWQSRTGQ